SLRDWSSDVCSSDLDFQFVEQRPWLPQLGLDYHMGVDGISLWFVLLSTVLTPICILASWEAIGTRVREYMIAFLVLETMMVGTRSEERRVGKEYRPR